jgi:hypothetical protein
MQSGEAAGTSLVVNQAAAYGSRGGTGFSITRDRHTAH